MVASELFLVDLNKVVDLNAKILTVEGMQIELKKFRTSKLLDFHISIVEGAKYQSYQLENGQYIAKQHKGVFYRSNGQKAGEKGGQVVDWQECTEAEFKTLLAYPITANERKAIAFAVEIHGRKAKTAIRNAWFNGNYRGECLNDYSGALQQMRNREGGSEALAATPLKYAKL